MSVLDIYDSSPKPRVADWMSFNSILPYLDALGEECLRRLKNSLPCRPITWAGRAANFLANGLNFP
ncbi:hypothetical protein ACCAA_550026 [Candidatus Accumulibacter aalborgensis]|uniref:Uncharacterized protein n=1 Tax=Candidatus Accumulibacter aalborgensis TaxID=1860102 RepID=A0A1A8XSY0_9PROT|nr:hypothetical protein ACCAA_550026 [Candidatus Accumulibacter aalborgensis]